MDSIKLKRSDPTSLRTSAEEVQADTDLDAFLSRKWRIAFYSPGMVGLGHIRRNLLIAQTLARTSLRSVILLIAEAREASSFTFPRGVDCLTLPALRKGFDGWHEPRYLDVGLQQLVDLRTRVIEAALDSFEPDVLIVDHLPRGAFQELYPALHNLRSSGRTRFILGLRDILEDPAIVQREWLTSENIRTIREYYSLIWIYGDAAIYDLVRECNLPPDIAAKARYTGYLDQRVRPRLSQSECVQLLFELGLPPGRLMLCLVGGGQDGIRLAEAFVQADLPLDSNGIVLTGPFMPLEARQRLRNLAAQRPRMRVLEFISEPVGLLSLAERVIAMGGYNTVCEILSFHKHALIVPRAKTRPEQLIRAERMRDLGLVDVLHPDYIEPEALSRWLACDKSPDMEISNEIDFNGLSRLSGLFKEVLTLPCVTAPASARKD